MPNTESILLITPSWRTNNYFSATTIILLIAQFWRTNKLFHWPWSV